MAHIVASLAVCRQLHEREVSALRQMDTDSLFLRTLVSRVEVGGPNHASDRATMA